MENKLTAQDIVEFFMNYKGDLKMHEKKNGIEKFVTIDPKEIAVFVCEQQDEIKTLQEDVDEYEVRDKEHIEMIEYYKEDLQDLKEQNRKLVDKNLKYEKEQFNGWSEWFKDYSKNIAYIELGKVIRELKEELSPLFLMILKGNEEMEEWAMSKFNSIFSDKTIKEKFDKYFCVKSDE